MRSSLARAFVFALLMIVGSIALAFLLHREGVRWYVEFLVDDALTGILGGVLVFLYMEERRRRAVRRVEELAYLNHHIRNALTAISLAPYAKNDDKRLQMIQDASSRIEGAIRKMSQQDHVSLADSEDKRVP